MFLPNQVERMTLLAIVLVCGLVVGVAVSSLVYVDCRRRDVPVYRRWLRTVSVGGGSFASFLVPYAFSTQLGYVYFQLLKPRPVTVSPYEWVAVILATGSMIGMLVVGLYVALTRSRTIRTRAST